MHETGPKFSLSRKSPHEISHHFSMFSAFKTVFAPARIPVIRLQPPLHYFELMEEDDGWTTRADALNNTETRLRAVRVQREFFSL